MGTKIFRVKASELGRRWDTSFHILDELSLPQKTKNLGRLAKILRGISVPSREYLDDSIEGGLLYIRISDMSNGELTDYAAKRIPTKFGKIQLRVGDILLSVRGSIGKTALVSKSFEGAVPSSQLVVLRPYEQFIDRSYLFKVLSSKTVQRQLDHIKTGAIISYVSTVELRKLRIPLPTFQDQLRIVKEIEELEGRYKGKSRELEKIKQQIDRIFEGEIV